MASLTALKNIADSYGFQLRLRGQLGPRLAYTTLYWGRYLAARYGPRRLDSGGAHCAAFAYLGRSGRSARTVTVATPQGLRLRVDLMTAFMVLKELYGERIYEDCDLDDFRVGEGQVVFDIGSQQGVFAVAAARRAGAGGRVVAVEPEPRNRELLLENIALNGLSNVRVFDCAISDQEGSARLFINAENTGAHSLVGAGSGRHVVVRTITLDRLAREAGCAPQLIKIDVEGSTLAVLRGGLETIAASKPRIVLELDAPEDEATIRALLEPLGYRLRRKGNNLFASAA